VATLFAPCQFLTHAQWEILNFFNQNTLRIWAQWVVVSILGWGAGLIPAYILDSVLIKTVSSDFRDLIPFYHFRDFIAFIVVGFSLGVAQWLVLRKYFPQLAQWVLATCAGIALGWNSTFVGAAVEIASMSGLYSHHYANVTFHFILGIISGTILGVAQWIVLRQKFQQAKLWIIANAIGEGLASALYSMWFTGFRGAMTGGLIAYLIVNKGIALTITGVPLIYLLKSSSSEAK
jgi:hypothetical protein